MGRFEVNATVANTASPERSTQVRLLVDTGATVSCLPRPVLEGLGVRAVSRSRFLLPDGRRIERDTGVVLFHLDGKVAGAAVMFAEAEDAAVLGATALEALGLAVDPVKQRLVPHDLYV